MDGGKRNMGSDSKVIDLFEYICLRIKQLGIRSIHGVPGTQKKKGKIKKKEIDFTPFRFSLRMVTD
jgi:hypothetical protein